jgi:hypothetical protein
MGWQIARDGRKLTAGTAVFGADGGLRGIARSLWVTPLVAAWKPRGRITQMGDPAANSGRRRPFAPACGRG